MTTRSILKEDRVASTIHIINNLVRGLTNKKAVKKVDTDYFVVASNTIDTIIDMIQNKAAKTATVVDDPGLQVINGLGQEDIRNITLVIARLPESCMQTIEYIITNTFPDIKITIKHINEIGEHMKTDLLISNPPYGKIGADITKAIRTKIDFDEFINLEPGNDYFTNDNYKYIDKKVKPVVMPVGAFTDANQATTATYISKNPNDLTPTGARLLLSIQNDDKEVYNALSELWLNTEKIGSLTFTRREVKSSPEWFVFNSGGFDICHGYFAVANRDTWTDSTKFNIYGIDAKTLSGLPSSKIKGCLSFKKLIYSELGLKLIRLWFTSSPEGWGFGGKSGDGMFADIDYSDCKTWNDVFDKLNVSKANQDILIAAANKFELNAKEKEICKIVEETL